MKTILYNPIFINPQAYYVFPQLYDIEKGDSFIEPAVYSGCLIIDDLISNTSSQVINTREVDFTQFAGKRIRISQYTNLGAVVLGEWLLPEGEQSGPSFHQSLVDAWFMSGLSNNDKPSSIRGVKGNEVILKNFAYSLSSGFGIWDFVKNLSSSTATKTFNSFHIYKFPGNYVYVIYTGNSDSKARRSFKIRITGVSDIAVDKNGNKRSLTVFCLQKDGKYKNVNIIKDGDYVIPECAAYDSINKKQNFFIQSNGSSTDCNITITQLDPAYEGALVFDGVDDYGICTGLPILDDYTVICKRIIETKSTNVVASKSTAPGNGAFIFEIYDNNKNSTWSFGIQSDVNINYNDSFSWQTKRSYNGKNVTVGNTNDTDKLLLGLLRENDARRLKGAIFYFALYNKSLTPEEIETEKERLNEEWLKRTKVTVPEPDVYYDMSLKDNSSPTCNIMDDLSGNGHDAEIFNAAYTESSGYRQDGAFVFDGVDDYAIMQNVTKGFKTVFIDVVPLNLDATIYDQRINASYTNFSIINKSGYVAYEYNNKGLTYINGKQSTVNDLADNLLNKRQIITVINGEQSNCKTIYIAANYNISSFSNMALYKLIGFYDELTPLQIEKVINDYKLKYD